MNPSTDSADQAESPLPDVAVLDACVLLNLFASRRVEEILASLPFRCLVASQVRREALWYLGASDKDDDRLQRHEIVLDPLIAAGRIQVAELTVDEEGLLVELAQNLGDGEAASGALAIGRAAFVATDDVKAVRVFRQLEPPLRTAGTPTLLRWWEERSGASASAITSTLQAIRRGARFSPRADAADASWWRDRS